MEEDNQNSKEETNQRKRLHSLFETGASSVNTLEENTKAALLHQLGQHHYAVATTDTAFKHMLSLSMGSDSSIVISLLNCFVPAFRGDPIVEVKEAPVAIPALRRPGEKQTFMDLHVVSSQGAHYIIEMQAQRHVMFDERALFYASATYARQLSERELSTENWYLNLKPVIALQVLDYDTNRIRGLKAEVPDTLVGRVKKYPLQEEQFIKHYLLRDQQSGQEIDYLQMVQVELPRAERGKQLFPPQADFSLSDWWVSILHYAHQYTSEEVKRLYQEERIMPEDIYKALNRLDLQQWNPRETKEYQEDLTRRDLYATTLAVEREEGEKIGREEERRTIARSMKLEGLSGEVIAKITGLMVEEIESL